MLVLRNPHRKDYRNLSEARDMILSLGLIAQMQFLDVWASNFLLYDKKDFGPLQVKEDKQIIQIEQFKSFKNPNLGSQTGV